MTEGGGIGFFDSGAGGLTVLRACYPTWRSGEKIYYYGDNARAPYGSLPPERIFAYAKEAFDVFASLRVRAAVIACNTVTAVCAEKFRRLYPFPVIGTEPALFPAARRGGRVFLLATPVTADSIRLNNLCARVRDTYPQTEVSVFACENLAGEVERLLASPREKKAETEGAFGGGLLGELPRGRPDGVVLGCTHYVFLRRAIADFYGCRVYDGNDGVARRLASVLSSSTIPSFAPSYAFFSTEEKTNMRSCCFSENRGILREKSRFSELFFLGSGKKRNKQVFKQMFVHNF